MRVLGYGEDALTFWSLNLCLDGFLRHTAIGDTTDTKDSVVFYRPSFGRSGGSSSAQFGEFDAIVLTKYALYLIESKWSGEPTVDGRIQLAGRQMQRHQIFTWLRAEWMAQSPVDWSQFSNVEENRLRFAATFQGKPLVKPGSRLSSNLEYILQATNLNVPTKNVLLYFHQESDRNIPIGVDGPVEFLFVPFLFNAMNPKFGGRIFEMAP